MNREQLLEIILSHLRTVKIIKDYTKVIKTL